MILKKILNNKLQPGLFACTLLALVWFTASSIVFTSSLSAASLQQQQNDLRKLQKRIGNLQKQIKKDTRLRDQSQALLEKIDRDIEATHHTLLQNKADFEKNEKRIQELDQEQEKALGRMGKQQQQLAAILKLAHQNRQKPALKMVLDEKDPAKIGRNMTYFRYLMQANEQKVVHLTSQVSAYVELLDKAKQEQVLRQTLQEKNKTNLQELRQSRTKRASLVNQLAANIKNQSSEVKKLESDENALNRVIAELERILESFPDTRQQAFKKFRGQLAWPIKGKLQNRFGQRRIPGQKIKWKGVFIEAARGTEVRAVAYGRVVYADWLPGHGLITILDHGDNYLSLYANAEMLFKEVGVWVQSGEIIATVGDSGGKMNTGLYFEIRRSKIAMNPSSWFKTRTP